MKFPSKFATVAGIGMLIVAGVGALMIPPPQEVSVTVTAMADPTESDRITELWLDVSNPGPLDFVPNFVVPGNALKNWYAWDVESGPAVLRAGESASYHITTPPYTGIQSSHSFTVIVLDAQDRPIQGRSDEVTPFIDREPPAVLNPNFQAWEHSMFHDTPLPYGWVHGLFLYEDDQYAITGEDGVIQLDLWPDPNSGVTTQLLPPPFDGEWIEEDRGWSLVSVRQRIDFPRQLTITIEDTDRGVFSAGARYQAGVYFQDPYARQEVVVLFAEPATDADQPQTQLVRFDGLESYRILVTNRSVSLDLLQIYEDNGWRLPTPGGVSRLLASGPGDVGIGTYSMAQATDRFQIIRPIEMKVFVASYPPHEVDHMQARFTYVGGPALDPAENRV